MVRVLTQGLCSCEGVWSDAVVRCGDGMDIERSSALWVRGSETVSGRSMDVDGR